MSETDVILTFTLHCFVNQTTTGAVHVEHVQVDPTDLRIEVAADRGARCDIGLHNISNDFDRLSVL